MKNALTNRALSFAVFFLLGCCSALAGTCPSGVPSGVTNCYFFADNGSDTANTGASESSPLLLAPGMHNCSGNCASITPVAGDGFIFKGGDTWHFGNSTAIPYVGGPDKYNQQWTVDTSWSGTSTNPIYWGVDKAWYSGASWSRPVFTGDNPTSTKAVAACTYPNSTTFFAISTTHNTIVDNFEFTGGCWTGNSFFTYLGWTAQTTGHDNLIENVYMHGWTHTPFNCPGGTPQPGDSCQGSTGIGGDSHQGYGVGDTIDHFVCDGSDSDPTSFSCILWDCYKVVDSYLHDATNGAICDNMHIWHDDIISYIYNTGDGVAHSNGFEFNVESTGTNYMYNIVEHNVTAPVTGWVCPTQTDYYWNILSYANASQSWDVATACGVSAIYFNNSTFADASGIGNSTSWPGHLTNMLMVNTGISGSGTTQTDVVTMTDAQAAKAGITSGSAFPYQLTSSNCNGATPCPVGAGANLSSNWPTGFSTDDTTFACTYVASNHTMSCPARTPVNRPAASGSPAPPWDVGAYELGTLTSSAPAPPSNLAAIVN